MLDDVATLSLIVLVLGILIHLIYIKLFGDKIYATDMFKLDRRNVVDLGGIPFYITLVASTTLAYLLGYLSSDVYLAVLMTISLAAVIGIIDDTFKSLPGWFKPVSALLIGIPILMFRLYIPNLKFFDGIIFNIPIIYPILVLIGFSVASNAVNMLDVINGSAAIGVLTVLLMNLTILLLSGETSLIMTLIFISAVLSFLIFNFYPSKLFMGNIGSMIMGSLIAFIAIFNRTEFLTVIAMYPFIVNGLFYLDRFRRFVERRVHGYRIAALNDDGLIEDACEKGAPIVLLKYLVSSCPKTEFRVFLEIFMLFVFSSLLSIIIYMYLW